MLDSPTKVEHTHPNCGNGGAWWPEQQTPGRSAILEEGAIDLGKAAELAPQTLEVNPVDAIFLAIDARDGNHSCDLTEIAFTLTEVGKDKGRVWDLATRVIGSGIGECGGRIGRFYRARRGMQRQL